MTIEIRLAELSDIAELVDHDIRHFREPGFNGQLAHPFPPHHPWDRDKMMMDRLKAMPKEITEEKWTRSFLLIEGGVIKGHLNLRNIFASSLHRAQLGMGMEESVRGRGLGKKLMTEAMAWARSQESLHWIDLSVFSHNLPAMKLYSSFGFETVAVFPDRLRVENVSIDDVYMALKLKS